MRPKFWKYKSVGKYLHDQYKYIRKVYKIPASDIIKELGFNNRSSLFNIFSGHVYVDIDDMRKYKIIFKLNSEEIQYIRLLTLYKKASSPFEKSIWENEINLHIKQCANTSREHRSLI